MNAEGVITRFADAYVYMLTERITETDRTVVKSVRCFDALSFIYYDIIFSLLYTLKRCHFVSIILGSSSIIWEHWHKFWHNLTKFGAVLVA